MTYEDGIILSNFMASGQQEIADEIWIKHNFDSPVKIQAALREAAWKGFCAGLEAGKKIDKEDFSMNLLTEADHTKRRERVAQFRSIAVSDEESLQNAIDLVELLNKERL